MKPLRLVHAVLAAALVAGTGAAAKDVLSREAARLIARGWQPYMALAGDAPPRQAIELLRNGLHLNQTVLMATDLAPALQALTDAVWRSLEDFDLDRLYHRLPDAQGGWRSLALAGRLAGERYAIRRMPVSNLDAPLTESGQMQALLSLYPSDDPRGTRYRAIMRFQANIGRVRWTSILDALRLGLIHISQPAAVVAPRSAMAGVAAMSPGLAPVEQQILAQLWTAFPASLGWYARFGTVADLLVGNDSTAQAKHLRLRLELDRDALKKHYPAVETYLEGLGDFLSARITIDNGRGRWLTARIDSASLHATVEFWLAGGELVPTRDGRPLLTAAAPGFPESATWRSSLSLRANAFGVSMHIERFQSRWRYLRLPQGAQVTAVTDTTPAVAVEGRLLGVLPIGWFEGLSPVGIKETVDDFMQVLATSNNGHGAQFLMRYDTAGDHGSTLKLAADWDGLNNFFVRLGVGMVSSRVIPDARQADGLRYFFHDALQAFGRDLGRWARGSWRESRAAADAARFCCGYLSRTRGRAGILAVIGKAGLGTPHMDGSTRLCTATAGAALKETFGSDGQPATYFDIDTTDTIFMIGHNMATTDTVLWSRILDRRRAANPPKLIVVDPRNTATAREADIHLAPKVGTNVSLLNGLLHLLIENDRIDRGFIDAHTIGFDNLKDTVSVYTPERVAEDTELTVDELRNAADAIGNAERLVSTVLQGVYQSNQATAAAVQVNNINLIRGMIGRPGCSVFQMNGQPTAQNTRETGADGDLPGFRNWENLEHIKELADIWNVDVSTIPHWAPPTHALNIFHQANSGSIRMLWISATNPAVSLPDLVKCRKTLAKEGLFIVVQDAFLNETTDYADVVLPTALWGEKTGTFTNVDRTVHLSRKAVEPPGEARSDFDIFVDFARRMDFRDKDNQPLISWDTPEGAFEAWKKCSRGRPCDYSGMSYEKLAAASGIPWPCNEEYPDGRARIYTDLKFPSESDYCERFGHDLETGGLITEDEHRAMNLAGRAFLKAAEQQPHVESVNDDYPMWLTTGRRVHQWHTRTKTGRSEALQKAQPEPYVQINPEDAEAQGIADGDTVRVSSPRGYAVAPARVRNIRRGHVFMPFHYGYWDQGESCLPSAANELTVYVWDPVSKQPSYKYAAVKLDKVTTAEAQQYSTQKPAKDQEPGKLSKAMSSAASAVKSGSGDEKEQPQYPAHVAEYLSLLIASEQRMKRGFGDVRQAHMNVPDIDPEMSMFSKWSDHAVELLQPFAEKYGEKAMDEAERLDKAFDLGRSGGSFALVRDLHDLWLMVNESMMSLIILDQAAEGLKDIDLLQALRRVSDNNERQKRWLLTRIRQAAPQALVVPN